MQDSKNSKNSENPRSQSSPKSIPAAEAAEPEASIASPKSAIDFQSDPFPIGLGGSLEPGEKLVRYYLSPLPYALEEDAIPWVEATSASVAAGMAWVLHPHWDGHFSHIEWNDSKTGERHLMATTTLGALRALRAVLEEKDAGRRRPGVGES